MDKFYVNGGCAANKQYFSGAGKCDLAEGVTDYLLIGRKSAVLTVPENGDLTDAIKTALSLPYDDANKLWLVGKITTNNAPEGGDMITNTKGTRGGSVITGQNPISIAYAMPDGVCLFNQLSRFNGMECGIFRIDRNKNVFGVGEQVTANDVVTETLKGFAASVWITNTPEADGGDVEMLTVNVSYGVDYFTSEFINRSNGMITETLVALNPVKIVKVATVAEGSVGAFKLVYNCSGEAVDSATLGLLDMECFTFTNATVTAVTLADGIFTVTGTVTTATTAVTAQLVTPDLLEVKGVTGIEGFAENTVIKAATA